MENLRDMRAQLEALLTSMCAADVECFAVDASAHYVLAMAAIQTAVGNLQLAEVAQSRAVAAIQLGGRR